MPADPILNEAGIVAVLDPEARITTEMLRRVGCLALMAARDRGVEREFFGDMLDLVSSINVGIADVETGVKMRQLQTLLQPDVPMEDFDALMKTHIDKLVGLRRSLQEKMILVSQCPTSSDKVS